MQGGHLAFLIPTGCVRSAKPWPTTTTTFRRNCNSVPTHWRMDCGVDGYDNT
jgi:hypothetical protein